MSEELKLLQNWNQMLDAIAKAEEHWKRLEGMKVYIDSTGVDSVVARAMTIGCSTRSFEMLLPDLVRFWRTHGGFDALRVHNELLDQFKPSKEKKDD